MGNSYADKEAARLEAAAIRIAEIMVQIIKSDQEYGRINNRPCPECAQRLCDLQE